MMANLAKLFFFLFSTVVSPKPFLFLNIDNNNNLSMDVEEGSLDIKSNTLPIKTKVNPLLIEPELPTS